MISEDYWRTQFKPWVDSYIEYMGFDPSGGYQKVYDQAKGVLMTQGYEAAKNYIQSLDKEDFQAITNKAGSIASNPSLYLYVGIPMLAAGIFLLRRSS